ncbi:MAG: glycoside hydrolase family 16 protein [Spirosomataceae bacterium]
MLFPLSEKAINPHSCQPVHNDSTNTSPKYQLIWSDEFDKEGVPDPTKWEFETGFSRNEEAQWYQKENAVCHNGNLVITAKKERKSNPNFKEGSNDWRTNRPFIEYTSASVKMKKEHAFRYGKMEVRAKIITQTGLWPAIWTLGVSGEWPSNGEVDVLEYYDDKILANYAIASTKRYNAIWDGFAKPMKDFSANWADSYHVWTLEWTEDKMEILLDGVSMNSIDLTQSFNKSDGKNPFRQPHYLLLNLALGGNRGGSLANTTFPSQYLIDYVRIYASK